LVPAFLQEAIDNAVQLTAPVFQQHGVGGTPDNDIAPGGVPVVIDLPAPSQAAP
jgi:hypothetical protein